jgi:hypothetical protein
MDQRSLVALEVGQQFADVVFQAPDACYAKNRWTPSLVLPFHPASPDGTFGKPRPAA